MPTNEVLIERIQRAFPESAIEAGGAFDDWGMTYPDANEYLARIDGKTWRNVDATWLVKRSDALGFLGTRWLVSLMPVYLVSAINDGVWSPATEMLVLILAKPGPGRDTGLGRKRFAALVEAFTAEQRAVIADTLDHIAQVDPAGSLGIAALDAFESGWNEQRKD